MKVAVLADNVALLEKHQEGASAMSAELSGGAVGAKACIDAIGKLMETVSAEHDRGRMSLEEAQAARGWLNHAVASCATVSRNGSTKAAEHRGLANGLETPLSVMREQLVKAEEELQFWRDNPDFVAKRQSLAERRAERIAGEVQTISDEDVKEISQEHIQEFLDRRN
jgi:hypothetical protein